MFKIITSLAIALMGVLAQAQTTESGNPAPSLNLTAKFPPQHLKR